MQCSWAWSLSDAAPKRLQLSRFSNSSVKWGPASSREDQGTFRVKCIGNRQKVGWGPHRGEAGGAADERIVGGAAAVAEQGGGDRASIEACVLRVAHLGQELLRGRQPAAHRMSLFQRRELVPLTGRSACTQIEPHQHIAHLWQAMLCGAWAAAQTYILWYLRHT